MGSQSWTRLNDWTTTKYRDQAVLSLLTCYASCHQIQQHLKKKKFAMVASTRNFRATTVILWERYRFVYRKVLLCWFVCPQRSFLVGVLGVKLFRRPWGFPDSRSGDGRECVFVHVGNREPLLCVSHCTPPSFISYRWLNAESAQSTFPTSETFPNGPRVFERTPCVICISNFIVSG